MPHYSPAPLWSLSRDHSNKELSLGGLQGLFKFDIWASIKALLKGAGVQGGEQIFPACAQNVLMCFPCECRSLCFLTGPHSPPPAPAWASLAGSPHHLSEALGARMTLALSMSSESPGDREPEGVYVTRWVAGSMCRGLSSMVGLSLGELGVTQLVATPSVQSLRWKFCLSFMSSRRGVCLFIYSKMKRLERTEPGSGIN